MGILSIQSSVSFGHVGNAAAVFPLQRLGFEVWPVPTVVVSNHAGYETFPGMTLKPETVAALVDGLAERGALKDCQAVLSGYLGTTATGRVAIAAAKRTKALRPEALFCCDPVIGDREDGPYVADDIVRFFREDAIGAADILVPNAFELEVLTGAPAGDVASAVTAARSLLSRGPEMIVVTSISPEAGKNATRSVGTVLVTGDGAWMVATPELSLDAKGTGDMFTALFLGYLLRDRDPTTALGHAVSSAYAVIESTVAADARELTLVQAQDRMVDPPRRFLAERIS